MKREQLRELDELYKKLPLFNAGELPHSTIFIGENNDGTLVHAYTTKSKVYVVTHNQENQIIDVQFGSQIPLSTMTASKHIFTNTCNFAFAKKLLENGIFVDFSSKLHLGKTSYMDGTYPVSAVLAFATNDGSMNLFSNDSMEASELADTTLFKGKPDKDGLSVNIKLVAGSIENQLVEHTKEKSFVIKESKTTNFVDISMIVSAIKNKDYVFIHPDLKEVVREFGKHTMPSLELSSELNA